MPLDNSQADLNKLNETIPFTELFNKASIAMFLMSSEGKVIMANAEANSLFSIDNNIISLDFEELFYTEKQFNIKEWYRNELAETTEHFQQNLRIRHPSENDLWGLIELGLINNNESKKVILCQIKNISEFQENNGKISQQGHLLIELINSLPDNIYVKDNRSRFILANSRVSKVMGADYANELIGKTDFDFYPKKLAQKYFNDEQEIINTGVPKIKIIEQVIDGENNRRWYSTSKLPLRDNEGKIIGIMGIGRDITDSVKEHKILRKAKHEADKANQLKAAFLANLSHEIRTPLNGILGFSQFLQQSNMSEDKRQKYLDIIISNGQHLLQIINDIIDVSKIDSGHVALNKKLFMLNELLLQLHELALQYARQLGKENLKILLETGLTDENSTCYGDDFRIKQVMINLLINAIKFTDHGTITFGYIIENKFFKLFVRDTGIGIAPENLSSIFERFRQEDNSLTRQYGGNGLGLSIVKGLVHLMGSKVIVVSEVAKGSEFSFTLPLDKKTVKHEDTSQNEEPVHEKKIAAINYNDAAFEYLEVMLIQNKIELIRIKDGPELANLKNSDKPLPDLFLVNYPIDQDVLKSEYQKIISMNSRIPVIIHLHSKNVPDEIDLRSLGADDYIVEPIDIEHLLKSINRLTNRLQ